MKRLTYILSILALLLAFSHNANATRQVRDIIIINKVEHRLNKVLRFMVSGTFICGTGECIYVAENGFDSVCTQETELIVENGIGSILILHVR